MRQLSCRRFCWVVASVFSLLAILASSLLTADVVRAEVFKPGCYATALDSNEPQSVSCDLSIFKAQGLNVEPNKCYLTRRTYIGWNLPAAIPCDTAQLNNIILTEGNQVGGPARPPIPAGCPGSPLGPNGDKSVCDKISIGCPGATAFILPLPTTFDPAKCKYQPTLGSPGAPAGPEAGKETKKTDEQAIDKNRESVIRCDGTVNERGENIPNAGKLAECFRKNPLVARFRDLINFLAAGVGIVVTIMIIIGGIQYSAAGNNPQAVTNAKKRIFGAILSLVGYAFLWAFMQWLVPGGLF